MSGFRAHRGGQQWFRSGDGGHLIMPLTSTFTDHAEVASALDIVLGEASDGVEVEVVEDRAEVATGG